ncbi:hypothetical protein [Vibrio ouci]|uniref:Uncharacterized protein n=1 Tax=Vibrio ouci TaxID=2499078 RepID=A0A4Y8W966_9VIBR|nr:hypothetical protein [Vibrio ouci]TFH89482.1 hypothetical protein ELS82_22025 [Vibrio ouci]
MLLVFYEKDNIRLNKLSVFSKQLAKDVYSCYQTFMSDKKKWKITENTFATRIRLFMSKFNGLVKLLEHSSLQSLQIYGLAVLKDTTTWRHLEYAAIRTCERAGKEIKNAFLMLARLFNDDIEIQSPSKVDLKGYVTDIAKLYGASDLLLNQYHTFLSHLLESDRSQKSLKDIKRSTHATLAKLIQNDEYREFLAKYGLRAFAVNIELFNAANKIDRYVASHFQLMLSHYDSKTFQQKFIYVKDCYEIDFTDIYRLSPVLFSDIECYSKLIGHTVSAHLKANSIRDKFSGFKRALPILQSNLSIELSKSLVEDGIESLVKKDGLLKQLHDDKDLPNWVFLLFHEICQCVYPDKTPELLSLRDNLLSFPYIDKNRELQCDFTSVKAISECMYDDFVHFLNDRKEDIEQKNYSMVSVYHNYQQVKSLLNKYKATFTQTHLDILRHHGIKGFEVSDGVVQKHLLAELQSSVNYDLFNRLTARTYRSSFAWLMREFDIPFNDVYPIKQTKTAKHNQRLNTDDFYTESQCRELAFYIEMLLRDGNTSLYHKVLLNFGKVILKTGWNISPLLNLECNDIVELESPITNKTEYAVVLQKARAGYRNDTYSFDKSDLKAGTLKSAITDLLSVRDELTKELREQTQHTNFVFIYPRNGDVLKLEYSSVKHLSTVLKNAGCRIPFVAQKIRKGGVNHIYRKVQKNIKQYTDTVKHSFDVFESSYLVIDPDQSRYSLNQATKVMSDYFTGKEISSEIHIITDVSASQHQVVPTGTCTAKANSDEANRYDKEHRKLHQANGDTDSKLCADFLSCIWCKYFRVVVDAEHVWKLLSYKNYILQDMEMSVIDFDDINHQITSINILKQRVDDIIANLCERNNKAVDDGFDLLDKHGIHPDWEFACPSMSLVKGK